MRSVPSRAHPDAPGRASRRSPDAERGAVADLAQVAWGIVRRVHLGTREPANWIQLFKFGLVGASGYIVNLAVFALLVKAASVHHIVAAVLSFGVAVTSNFILNRVWTFQARAGHAGFQAARFFTVSVGALGVNLIVLYGLVDLANAPTVASQAIAIAAAMPFNFVGNKLWTFGGDH
jgi:dolichol-phosphate mannosyltransferase